MPKNSAANALDILPLCTFPHVTDIQRVVYPTIPLCSALPGSRNTVAGFSGELVCLTCFCRAQRHRGPTVTLAWPRCVCTPRPTSGPPPPSVQFVLFPAPTHQPTWIFNKLCVAELVLLFRTLLSVTMNTLLRDSEEQLKGIPLIFVHSSGRIPIT